MRLKHESREWSQIDAAVFRTITSADWRRAVRDARAVGNVMSERIRNRILNLAKPPADGQAANEIKNKGVT
jgi:Mn-dependent DtxR family transcriptional regulator